MLPFSNLLGTIPINTADGGHIVYETPGTYQWICPAGVFTVALLAVAGGAAYLASQSGGGGGELRWKNRVRVEPGQAYDVVVGAAGGVTSFSFAGQTLLLANPGVGTVGGSGGIGDGGGNGGTGGPTNAGGQGGGGAGGYSGPGGNGGSTSVAATAGQGGGGGGAGGASGSGSSGGGGVGKWGEGPSGAAGPSGTAGNPGIGGSYGQSGQQLSTGGSTTDQGGFYGGGGARHGRGGKGVLRIVWGKGQDNGGRAFPSSLVDSAEGHQGNATALYSLSDASGNTGTSESNIPALYDGDRSQTGTPALVSTAALPVVRIRFPEGERAFFGFVFQSNVQTTWSYRIRKDGVWGSWLGTVNTSGDTIRSNAFKGDAIEFRRDNYSAFNMYEFAPFYRD
ncbi:hypothetical protein [Aureimonas phyllosphaerae]|uniref:Uncharacterized protein n=1 Tax=Aureimonas phyllosphaerae TaxID=1166078 RepID=A0A7W6FVZ9_9HYPH|nr:hypothetical protein [Aureimonas phyllosphaerae]MBB3937666.1 hypothetical protein [Aureimonas phyllosphaerae]MBB3961798.1 hypothetical protein [Aureimonas phyllosphaerae]SFF44900.1 hypothetical protein SAMN05216566_1146 [Aureimonas phyllosphaerae]